ncbi:MAG: glycosyltransferase [Candidatus Paracaedibacteraceae bacterium]|nr:glycosyltransferase [Candidatus Paracaedibacteraceae bacterium]
MIKLAFIITGLGRGGAERMLLKLLSSIDRPRFDARVFCLTTTADLRSEFEAFGIKVYTYQLNKPLLMLVSLWRFLKDCRQFAPHLIQGWMYHGNIFAWLAHKGCPSKLLFGIRASLYDLNFERRLTRWIIRLGSYLSSSTDGIIYVSTVARHQHELIGYTSKKSITIANGFDLEKFKANPGFRLDYRQKLQLLDTNIAIGFFARFHKLKGFKDLLQAFASVHKKNPLTKLVLAGQHIDDQNIELKEIIAHYKLQQYVLLLGQLTHPERCLPALDLFVSPSLQEGFPNVVGEAMACGVPCVVTDVGDSALAVGETGMIVQPADPNALTQAILKIIEYPEKLPAWGQQARQRIEENFSLATIVKQYETAYSHSVENT